MSEPLLVECQVHFARGGRGAAREMRVGTAPPSSGEPRRVSRLARLMALALRCERLVQERVVRDHAELARLGHVTRARISQILHLVHLAPDIQEEILFLTRPARGRDPFQLRYLQPIAMVFDWQKQRRRWRALKQQFGVVE